MKRSQQIFKTLTASVAMFVITQTGITPGALAQTSHGGQESGWEYGQQQEQQQWQDQFDQRFESGRAFGRTVEGTISEIRNVQLPGQDQAWAVAKVQTHAGEMKTVLLGPPERLQRLNLKAGSQIKVQGLIAGAPERGLVAAQRIESGGQAITIARGFQPEQDRAFGYAEPQYDRDDQYGSQMMTRTVEGTIGDIRSVRMPGQDQNFYIASVETHEGDSKTVLLGPESRLQQLDLRPGDNVTVQALLAPGHGRGIFAAQRIQANGRSVTLARTFMRGDEFGYQPQQMGDGRAYGHTVQGTITQLRTVSLPEQEKSWVVAGVQMPDGHTTTVLLGPEDRLQKLNLKKGDDIYVRGAIAAAQGRGIFAAQRVESGGQSITMAGSMPMENEQFFGYADSQQQQMMDQDSSMRSFTRHVAGNIEQLRTINLPGQDEAWVAARVSQPDGSTKTVLLGPEQRVKQHNVQQGDYIEVDGFIAGSPERGVVAARRVQINGQTFTTGGTMSPQEFQERRRW